MPMHPTRPVYPSNQKFVKTEDSLQEWDTLNTYYQGEIKKLKAEVRKLKKSLSSNKEGSQAKTSRSSCQNTARKSSSERKALKLRLLELFGESPPPSDGSESDGSDAETTLPKCKRQYKGRESSGGSNTESLPKKKPSKRKTSDEVENPKLKIKKEEKIDVGTLPNTWIPSRWTPIGPPISPSTNPFWRPPNTPHGASKNTLSNSHRTPHKAPPNTSRNPHWTPQNTPNGPPPNTLSNPHGKPQNTYGLPHRTPSTNLRPPHGTPQGTFKLPIGIPLKTLKLPPGTPSTSSRTPRGTPQSNFKLPQETPPKSLKLPPGTPSTTFNQLQVDTKCEMNPLSLNHNNDNRQGYSAENKMNCKVLAKNNRRNKNEVSIFSPSYKKEVSIFSPSYPEYEKISQKDSTSNADGSPSTSSHSLPKPPNQCSQDTFKVPFPVKDSPLKNHPKAKQPLKTLKLPPGTPSTSSRTPRGTPQSNFKLLQETPPKTLKLPPGTPSTTFNQLQGDSKCEGDTKREVNPVSSSHNSDNGQSYSVENKTNLKVLAKNTKRNKKEVSIFSPSYPEDEKISQKDSTSNADGSPPTSSHSLPKAPNQDSQDNFKVPFPVKDSPLMKHPKAKQPLKTNPLNLLKNSRNTKEIAQRANNCQVKCVDVVGSIIQKSKENEIPSDRKKIELLRQEDINKRKAYTLEKYNEFGEAEHVRASCEALGIEGISQEKIELIEVGMKAIEMINTIIPLSPLRSP